MNISLMAHEQGFEMREGDKLLSELIWTLDVDVMVLHNLVVHPAQNGEAYATRLLDDAAEYARMNHYKMEAICPFVMKYFEQSNAYNDLKV